MNKIYQWIDRIWQWIAETVFVRFEFGLPTEELRELSLRGKVVFAITHGGVIEWLILSSWCRSQKMPPILVANRKRVLILAKPKYFLQVLFRRRRYADLFLSSEAGARLVFVSGRERRQLYVATPSENLLCEIYSESSAAGKLADVTIVPVFILWRKHMRGAARKLSEYLFGLSSNPNLFGKLWYLARRRMDSTVKSLAAFTMSGREGEEALDGFEETEAMRAAKSARRRILVSVNQEMRVVLGPRYHSPHSVKETLLRDPDIQAVIAELAQAEGVDRRKVMSKAYQNLTEIVANYKYRFIEVMYVFLTWLFSKVFDGLVAEQDEWHRVREVMKTKPVVFVPCHRSHLDYLVIPYLLFEYDMVTPHIAAGINLAFWPVGPLLRMGGAFFIRRSFRGDKLYSALLRKYVEYLVKNRYNLKFFIEGTRSRSGKMLAPAYGMLKMILETYRNKITDDVAFIPVSLCYDEVPEQGAYTKELGGGQKVQESAVALIKSGQIVKRRFGKVYVRLSEPLYAKDLYQASDSAGLDSTLMLQKTAFQICKAINDVTPITPKSLVSSVLLSYRLNAVPLEDVLRLCQMLASYVDYSNHSLSVTEESGFRRALEQTVRRLQKSNVISISEAVPRGYFCENKKRILLNFYKNNAIHCFVLPSITVLAFFDTLRSPAVEEPGEFHVQFIQTALRLRNILKFEFFFSPTPVFLTELERDCAFFFGDEPWIHRNVRSLLDSMRGRLGDWNDVSVFLSFLGELLESYLTFAVFLKETPEKSWEKRGLIQKIVKHAEGLHQQGKIAYPESISIQNYSNALSFFDNQKIIVIEKEAEKTNIKQLSADEKLITLIEQLTGFLELMQEKPEVFVHPEARLKIF